MKTYIELFIRSIDGKKLVPACGTDSVFKIDGRLARCRWEGLAKDRIEHLSRLNRGFCGYRVIRGESLRESKPLTPIIELK